MSKDEIAGVAWALMYPTADEVMVVAVVDDTLLTHQDGEWSADVYGRRRAPDTMAVLLTKEAEANGLELVAGPTGITVPSSTFADYGFLAKVALIRLWKSLPENADEPTVKRALNAADERISKPEAWAATTGKGVH